jgi:protein-L-isoaspartate(D-aspartate) O-methyltransferase
MAAGADQLLKTLARHVHDERVLDAIRTVPRDAFVPPELRDDAWENIPLPIGSDQTISQPLVVARMLELLQLRGDERVLDVGTGSGYHAALLARLAAAVWSIEVHPELSARRRTTSPRRWSSSWAPAVASSHRSSAATSTSCSCGGRTGTWSARGSSASASCR